MTYAANPANEGGTEGAWINEDGVMMIDASVLINDFGILDSVSTTWEGNTITFTLFDTPAGRRERLTVDTGDGRGNVERSFRSVRHSNYFSHTTMPNRHGSIFQRHPHFIRVNRLSTADATWYNHGLMGVVADIPEMLLMPGSPIKFSPRAYAGVKAASYALYSALPERRLTPGDIKVTFMGNAYFFDRNFNFRFID